MSDANSIPQRRCTKCGEEFPATLDYFMKRSANKDGLGSWCRNCAHEYNRTPAAKESKKRYAETPAGKAVLAKAKVKYKPKRLETDRLYNTTPKAKSARRKYNKSHKSKIAHKRYNATPKGQLSLLVRGHSYRARKRSLDVQFSGEDWERAIKYFDGCCAVCGRPPGLWHTLAADHWIPLNSPDCPGTIPTNIVPLCHGIDGCNNSKHSKLPQEWLIWKFGKRKANSIFNRIMVYFNSLEVETPNG